MSDLNNNKIFIRAHNKMCTLSKKKEQTVRHGKNTKNTKKLSVCMIRVNYKQLEVKDSQFLLP